MVGRGSDSDVKLAYGEMVRSSRTSSGYRWAGRLNGAPSARGASTVEYPSVSFWAMRSISRLRLSSSSLRPSLLHSLLVLRQKGL